MDDGKTRQSYTQQDLENALKSVGINKDDTIMVHSGLSRLGVLMQGVKNANELSATIIKSTTKCCRTKWHNCRSNLYIFIRKRRNL